MASKRRKAKGKRAVAKKDESSQGTEIHGLELQEFSVEEYSGELPHPEILRGFNEIVPGSADLIFDELRANGRHRRKQENRIIRANTWTFSFSVVSAWVIEAAALVFGGYLIVTDQQAEGFTILVGQIALLRWGRKK